MLGLHRRSGLGITRSADVKLVGARDERDNFEMVWPTSSVWSAVRGASGRHAT
jgi:hypothetical protein